MLFAKNPFRVVILSEAKDLTYSDAITPLILCDPSPTVRSLAVCAARDDKSARRQRENARFLRAVVERAKNANLF